MREAVTAIFVHERDIFVIRRQNYLRAFPGYYAFPGGKVDPEDAGVVFDHPLLRSLPPQVMQALIREVDEELNFDLLEAIESGQVVEIIPFGEAVTPPFEKVRFRAHYMKVVMRERPDLQPDRQEIAWSDWVDHRELYQRYDEGDALMVVPTMHTVRALAENITANAATPFNLEYDIKAELPYLELLNGIGYLPIPSNTLPPAKNTNALLIGDEGAPRYLVDPSPESEKVYQRLKNTLAGHRVDGIMISHHHPDHHEEAPRLARELGLPLRCSAITREFLAQRHGSDYLQGVEYQPFEADEILTYWLGQPVRGYALPGHDTGMIGLAPDNMAWFFIADLAQAGASVVIPEHGGDMLAYFDTLTRVIAMRPRVVIPSHGMPMGGTLLLEKTLQHRQKRETQVARYLEQGEDPETITALLYQGLEERLHRLALMNVRQHIRKLAQSSCD